MKKIVTLACCISCIGFSFAATDSIFSASSPDKLLRFFLRLHDHSSVEYRAEYKGKEILNWSTLELVTNKGIIPGNQTTITTITRSFTNETFPWMFGEKDLIYNQYHEIIIHFVQAGGIAFNIGVRIFNNNFAFRYEFPLQKNLPAFHIYKENTNFNFNQSFTVYRHNQESVISPVQINGLKTPSDFPLVLTAPDLFISINEAKNTGYTKAVIAKAEKENSLQTQFSKDTVEAKGAFQTPWRTVTIVEKATALCDNSDLLYKLNDQPNPAKNYVWIKPGKLIRDMTLTTKGALSCIDFAVKMNFQYVMFDAGWYGKGYYAEFDRSSEPNHVVKEIDMQEVIHYGTQKNIGLILYVNYVGLRKYNMDSLFTLYKNWGIKGLKFGFVNGLTQDGISWLMGAVKKAQDYGFIIDVHDNYKPTGISRTIPAWLTQEGVRGNENNPDAFHNTTLPFTRFLSGPADYTFCYRNQNDSFNTTLLSKKLQVSQAQQLALTVIFYSPIQSMLWYGKPADYTLPDQIEFFKNVPTTWNQTIHLSGEIGRYAMVARRKSNIWFVGVAVNDQEYSTTLKLDFLTKGKNYIASVYSDDGSGGIQKTTKKVDANSVIPVLIHPKGGEAMMIIPEH